MNCCNECPFVKRDDETFRGYISAYESGMDLHDLVIQDAEFKCHKDEKDICRGFALYMNKLCKRSRYENTLKMQEEAELEDGEEILSSFDGSVITKWHSIHNGDE